MWKKKKQPEIVKIIEAYPKPKIKERVLLGTLKEVYLYGIAPDPYCLLPDYKYYTSPEKAFAAYPDSKVSVFPAYKVGDEYILARSITALKVDQ